MFRSLFFLVITSCALSACGFQPLNAEKTLVDQRNATILILPISDRPGQVLHNHLRDSLNPKGMPERPDYKLVVDLGQKSGSVAGRTSSESTREFVEVTAKYQLLDARNDRSIYANSSVSRVHYAGYTLSYDSGPAKDAALNNALRLLSGEITRALSFRLARIKER